MPAVYNLKCYRAFSAAHFLRDYEGPCARLHGHDYKVEVEVCANQLMPNGLAIDSSDIKQALMNVIDRVDHRCLNDIEPFTEINPSAENIAAWFYQEIKSQLAERSNLWLEAVIIHETEKFSVRYSESD